MSSNERDIRNSVPDNMIINGVECSDKQAIVKHFNSFFATVGELNSRNITEHNDSSYRDYLSERIESSFEFRLVDSCYCRALFVYTFYDQLATYTIYLLQ